MLTQKKKSLHSNMPVVGQSYNYFDDGKIKLSRKMEVVITEIIPFDKIDEETLIDWKEEVEECYWLYAKETDYFMKGNLKIECSYKNHLGFPGERDENVIFVRTIDNSHSWFSIGLWCGRLDVDGSLSSFLDEV